MRNIMCANDVINLFKDNSGVCEFVRLHFDSRSGIIELTFQDEIHNVTPFNLQIAMVKLKSINPNINISTYFVNKDEIYKRIQELNSEILRLQEACRAIESMEPYRKPRTK